MYDREQYFFEAIAAGAAGYVLKQQADRDLVSAAGRAAHEPFIYPAALGALMRRYLERVERGEQPGRGPLTPRETEVVKLIAEGHSSAEIAELLMISPKTVERHRANILGQARHAGPGRGHPLRDPLGPPGAMTAAAVAGTPRSATTGWHHG